MSRCSAAPFTLARAIAVIAFALVLNARANAEAAPSPAPLSLSGLSAARETAAPAATTTATVPLTPAEGATPVATATATDLAGTPAKALEQQARDEVIGSLNLGKSLTEREQPDFEGAELAYRQALNSPVAETKEIKTALLGLAHMFRKKGEFAKAAGVYEKYLAEYPGDDRSPDALLELGRTLRDMGTYNMAIARFYSVINSTLKVAGDNFERYQVLAKTAQFEIAETHFLAGNFREANKFYTKFRLLDVAPADRARAHFKAADSLRREGNLEGGATALRAFIEQWPNDENIPEARYLLAQSLRELKRPQEAFAVALDLLKAEKSRSASSPKRWMHWQLVTGNQLANEFFEAGNIAEAHTIYTAMLELSPELSWKLPITYQLGLCFERMGILDKARASYQAVVEQAGPKPLAQFNELAQMATWRIEHMTWRDRVNRDVSAFFDSTTGKQTSIPAAASKEAPAAP